MRLTIASLRRRRRPREERARLHHPGMSCCECVGRRLVGWRIGPHLAEPHRWAQIWQHIDQCIGCHLLHRNTDGPFGEKTW